MYGTIICRFPRFYAAASLKPKAWNAASAVLRWFSAVLCRGLIEATPRARTTRSGHRRFPRFYAAASLKRDEAHHGDRVLHRFPRFYAAASLKLWERWPNQALGRRFPRFYAAASLKQVLADGIEVACTPFSAVLCRGLIEAIQSNCGICSKVMFSAVLCRGLIEAIRITLSSCDDMPVFRGFMPRPH